MAPKPSSYGFYAGDRVALFIDGANLHAAARALRLDIDFRRLRAFFASQARLVRAFYYTALIEEGDYSPLRPLVDWLDYNGFTVITKPAKTFTDSDGQRRIKGNMDIEIAVDVMDFAAHMDHLVLFSGDGDFRRLVEAVQWKGVKVTVCSTTRGSPALIADELRRQADQFLELEELRSEVARVDTDGAQA
ncbi:MAG TPA: NYN domain-containing protein [Sphingomonadales bacterium]|jgi:uncharacterized LabA/DUF88 family protein